jgi:hypothetical protein
MNNMFKKYCITYEGELVTIHLDKFHHSSAPEGLNVSFCDKIDL